IKNVNWKRNKFLAKTPEQTTLYLENYTKSSISSFAQADSNIYARPIHDDSSITIHNRLTKSEINEFSVKEWSSKNQFDLNSKQSPLRFNNTPIDAIIFETNPSNTAKGIKFQGLYTTLKGELLQNSTTIPPFSSIILLPTKDLQTLPIKFVQTNGIQEKNAIHINWTIEGYEEFNYFSIDWSEDGRFFKEKSQTGISKNIIAQSSFIYIDNLPRKGMNYYRIRAMKGSDTIASSQVLKINFISGNPKFKAYPNPVLKQPLNFQIDDIEKGQYYLSIYTTNGILLHKQTIIHPGGLLLNSFRNVSILQPGNYIVQLVAENNSMKWEQKFLKL
ncbi:MAG: T9SS type A sorting domain-containing protein, partial [Flavobacterium sp.]